MARSTSLSPTNILSLFPGSLAKTEMIVLLFWVKIQIE